MEQQKQTQLNVGTCVSQVPTSNMALRIELEKAKYKLFKSKHFMYSESVNICPRLTKHSFDSVDNGRFIDNILYFTRFFYCGIYWASSRENLSSVFPSKLVSNRYPQLQRLARKLKFHL